MAIQVVSQVRDTFGLELPIKTVFDAGTLEALAGQIDLALLQGLHAPRMPAIEATPQEGAAPLSFSQERMWLIQSLDPASTAYNMVVALRVGGKLDTAALSGALRTLHERHAILRSTIRVVDNRPQQEIGPVPDAPLAIVDLRNRDGDEAMAEAVRLAEADAQTPFDLAQGPVMRSRLFRTGDEASLLSLVLHHVAGDQWSIGVLGRELALLYNAAVGGSQAELPKLPISYRDYALWQRSGLLGPELERQMAFWLRKLDDLPPAELPTDRPRPRLRSMKGGFCQIAIPPALTGVLDKLCRSTGSTLFMTMLTAFATLLHRTTGQEDIPIGVPVANRTQSVTEGLVGTFVNTLVLRTDLSGNPTFGQALQRVRATALEAFANQDVPFDWLVQELGQRRDTTRAPLVQIMFNVANAPMHGIEFDGLDWEPVIVDRGGAQFELSMAVDPIITRQLSVEYNTDLFDRPTIERLIGRYFTILEAAAAAPATALTALPLLPDAERRLLSAWNATDAPYPRDRIFGTLFEEQAARDARRRRGFFRRRRIELCEAQCAGECGRAPAARARGWRRRAGRRSAFRALQRCWRRCLASRSRAAPMCRLTPTIRRNGWNTCSPTAAPRCWSRQAMRPTGCELPDGVEALDLDTLARPARPDNPDRRRRATRHRLRHLYIRLDRPAQGRRGAAWCAHEFPVLHAGKSGPDG